MLSALASTGDITGANIYIDTVINSIRPFLQDEGLEYLETPDITTSGVFLYDGQLFGLATLRRKGEAKLCNNTDGVTIEATLQLQQVRLCYDYDAKVLFARNKGDISVCAGEIEAFIRIFQSHDLNKSPTLQEFTVHRLLGLRICHSGMGPLSWLLNRLQRSLLATFRERIQQFVSVKIRSLLQEELNKFSLSDMSIVNLLSWPHANTSSTRIDQTQSHLQ